MSSQTFNNAGFDAESHFHPTNHPTIIITDTEANSSIGIVGMRTEIPMSDSSDFGPYGCNCGVCDTCRAIRDSERTDIEDSTLVRTLHPISYSPPFAMCLSLYGLSSWLKNTRTTTSQTLSSTSAASSRHASSPLIPPASLNTTSRSHLYHPYQSIAGQLRHTARSDLLPSQ